MVWWKVNGEVTHLVGFVAGGDVVVVRQGNDALVVVYVVHEVWKSLKL